MIRSPIPLILLVLASMLGSVPALAQTKASPVNASVVNASEPNALIETAANAMVSELESRRVELRKDPAKLGELVDRILLPHFDVNHAARLVLGKHWRTATPEQRQQFIDAFYGSLMSNYGDALLEFTGDRIKVLPTPVPAAAALTI